MVRLGPEEQRICPVSRCRVATELGSEHSSVISFPASFSRIPKQMASQMKSPVVSGLQKDPSLRGLLREKGGLRFCQQLRVYNGIKLGMNHRAVRTSRILGAAEFCKPCQQQETLKNGINFRKQWDSADGVGIHTPSGAVQKAQVTTNTRVLKYTKLGSKAVSQSLELL